jgi:gentisate 1,2-dioxygenase
VTQRAQQPTKLDRIFELRDEQRALRRGGKTIAKGDELPWEQNRHGKMKWYMHPDMTDNCLNTLIFYVQELPPAGRSGKQKSQGGQTGVVWEGRGYTLVDGVRHDWEKHDVFSFPVRTAGITVQHVNLDTEKPALLAFCEPNTYDALGVDRGCGFEQIEDAPD